MQPTASEYSPHAFVSNYRGRESMQSDALHEQEHVALLAPSALSSAPEGLTSPDEEQQNPGEFNGIAKPDDGSVLSNSHTRLMP